MPSEGTEPHALGSERRGRGLPEHGL